MKSLESVQYGYYYFYDRTTIFYFILAARMHLIYQKWQQRHL